MATTTRPRAATGDRAGLHRAGRLVAAAALVVGLVALYTNGARVADPAGSVPAIATGGTAPRLVPTSIGSLDRAWALTGDEAARQIASLHVGAVRVDEAEIAGYGQDTTVWVATVADAPAAHRMVTAMVRAIDRGGSPFDPPARVAELPGAYETTGNGQTHLFFASGDAVWWLASASATDAIALTKTLAEEVAR